MTNPIKRWKLSPMDCNRADIGWTTQKLRTKCLRTRIPVTPWFVVNADNKKRARLNCIAHLLQQVPYHDMTPVEVDLPPRHSADYKRPKKSTQRFVPEIY